jgi:hypothetical protein
VFFSWLFNFLMVSDKNACQQLVLLLILTCRSGYQPSAIGPHEELIQEMFSSC